MENKYAEEWWKTAGQKNKDYYRRIYRNLRFNVQEPVLEIGGGAGTFLNYIGCKNATILDVAGKESLMGNYQFIFTNITEKLPNFKNKFKTIFIMEVLEHIKNPLYLLGQIYDLLDEDGICYISVPYTKLDYNRIKQKNKFNCHVCRWKKGELIDQVLKLGFIPRVIQERRRFKNTAFYLPYCWLVLELKKRKLH